MLIISEMLLLDQLLADQANSLLSISRKNKSPKNNSSRKHLLESKKYLLEAESRKISSITFSPSIVQISKRKKLASKV